MAVWKIAFVFTVQRSVEGGMKLKTHIKYTEKLFQRFLYVTTESDVEEQKRWQSISKEFLTYTLYQNSYVHPSVLQTSSLAFDFFFASGRWQPVEIYLSPSSNLCGLN